MELTLRDLQLLAEAQYTVDKNREDLAEIVKFFKEQEIHDEAMNALCEARQLSRSIVDEMNVFFIPETVLPGDLPEHLRHESLGMVKFGHITMSGRMVYPVYDVKKQVMGFCGWDGWDTPKYLDSKNYGYVAKATTLFGMEKMEEYYKSGKPVYVVEGIVCCLYLRSLGLQCLALLGSTMSFYVIEILKRFGHKLIIIPDNDLIGKEADDATSENSGEHLVKFSKRKFKQAVIVQSKIAKDPDDTRKFEDHKYEEEFKRDLIAIGINPFARTTTLILR